ncbi:hypothetical protein SAMN05421770_106116 [Granulicella rosea]|uniref:Uncharacterized protein n=1 Tax=Granulicella rosea TaxID=474952 RepID=A0A239L6C0_9BACT|nr:hypothetical protein [Granulicella rosea]SNT25562.1 hypothetical protein SAMN05421770_106116 [Granulicella rosea]
MSLYLSDGDSYAGWHSTGRWFAFAGAVAGAAALAGYVFTHGYLAANLPASDQMVAFMAQWVGGGFAALMAFAAYGSIGMSREERGDVEVSETGVRRILEPGRENFLPRAEIAGMIVRRSGGVDLVDHSGQQRMVIPRSLDGYRDCIAEIKALGVERLPAKAVIARKKPASGEWALTMAMLLCFEFTLNKNTVMKHHVAGILLVAIVAGRVLVDWRKKKTGPLGAWLMMLCAVCWVVYRWVWVW